MNPDDAVDVGKGFLHKRKDFLAVEEEARSHPNRTYYYRKNFDSEEIIQTCSKKLQVCLQLYAPTSITVTFVSFIDRLTQGMPKHSTFAEVRLLKNVITISLFKTSILFSNKMRDMSSAYIPEVVLFLSC